MLFAPDIHQGAPQPVRCLFSEMLFNKAPFPPRCSAIFAVMAHCPPEIPRCIQAMFEGENALRAVSDFAPERESNGPCPSLVAALVASSGQPPFSPSAYAPCRLPMA